MTLWLVDVSNHQGNIDIGRIASEGFSAVWCKATEGTTFKDAKFLRNIGLIRQTHMIPGAYHFLRSSSGRTQARAFYNRLRDVGGPGGFLCACDNEADATLTVTRDFFDEWNKLTDGHPLFMYTGAWWWTPRGWNGTQFTPFLWHSRYVSGEGYASVLAQKVPSTWWSPGYGGWDKATILQFTSSAIVAGQRVDANMFPGSLDDLRSFTGNNPVIGSDMEQSDILTADTGNPGRTVGDFMGDVERLRNYLIGGPGPGADQPMDGTPLARLIAMADRPDVTIELSSEDRDAIVSQITSEIAPMLTSLRKLMTALDLAGAALGSIIPDEEESLNG